LQELVSQQQSRRPVLVSQVPWQPESAMRPVLQALEWRELPVYHRLAEVASVASSQQPQELFQAGVVVVEEQVSTCCVSSTYQCQHVQTVVTSFQQRYTHKYTIKWHLICEAE
jgi:hypothetical protein